LVCILAAVWADATGPAATGWLIALIATGFFGVPLALVAMRLFDVEDSSGD
jgi:hypothetical protein